MLAVDLLILAPLALSVLALVAGARSARSARAAALAAPLVQVALLFLVWPVVAREGVASGIAGTQTALLWHLRADGLSLPLVALTAITGLLAVSASWRISIRPGAHYALLAFLQAAVATVFLADSLLLFYIAWESVLVPMFLLIGVWGSAGSRRASMKFLVYTFAGGAVLLIGVLYALVSGGVDSISLLSASAATAPGGALLFWLLAVGFLVKVPAVPLHTWLPDAHTEAPTAGSILLAGVLLKMGGYGLIRVALPLAPAGFEAAAPVIVALGIVGVIWGAATALVQSDLKRLVAYSSVAHMGFVLIAIGVGTPEALSAALVTMVSHGFVAGLLFYLVGTLYERTHTRELAAFGGLGSIAPRWSVAFVFASLASAGLPGLSGFPGEFVTTLATFEAYAWWTLLPAIGIVLAAAYNLRAVRRSIQGPLGPTTVLADLDPRESLSTAFIGIAVLTLGLAPWLVTGPAQAVLQAIASAVGRGGQ